MNIRLVNERSGEARGICFVVGGDWLPLFAWDEYDLQRVYGIDRHASARLITRAVGNPGESEYHAKRRLAFLDQLPEC